MQNGEIEYKIKNDWQLSDNIFSWDKQNSGEKLDEDWNSSPAYILIQRLHYKGKYEAQQQLLN